VTQRDEETTAFHVTQFLVTPFRPAAVSRLGVVASLPPPDDCVSSDHFAAWMR
jgi:hypothetical protein